MYVMLEEHWTDDIWVCRCQQVTCTELRKQKEIEFDILHAEIQGWEGQVRKHSFAVIIIKLGSKLFVS